MMRSLAHARYALVPPWGLASVFEAHPGLTSGAFLFRRCAAGVVAARVSCSFLRRPKCPSGFRAHSLGDPSSAHRRRPNVKSFDVVVFVGPFFCLVQFPYGFIDMFHGRDTVATPFAAGVFEVIAGALQGAASGFHVGGHVALLRSAREEAGRGGYDHHQEHSQSCQSHGNLLRKLGCGAVCTVQKGGGNQGFPAIRMEGTIAYKRLTGSRTVHWISSLPEARVLLCVVRSIYALANNFARFAGFGIRYRVYRRRCFRHSADPG